ncbi:hypothetical protein ACFL35_13870 [Candidatus Riflebacteria bacterium]
MELKISQGISNKVLAEKLIELLNRGNIPLLQKEINEILAYNLEALPEEEKEIIREYVDYFRCRVMSQDEVDELIRQVEMSLGKKKD